jgi:hypothetical protein
MSENEEKPKKRINRFQAALITAPWSLAAGLGKLLYGFRTEGFEKIPHEGPYIVWLTEPSFLGMFVSGYVSIKVLKPEMDKDPDNNVSFFHEELFRLAYFRRLEEVGGHYRPLVPHSAPNLAKGILDGYRVLLNKGIVVHNPQGDAPWDGRPVVIGRITGWLALRTAAPVLPVLCSVGAYEIWPRWQLLPSRKGRLKVTVYDPIRLCDKPLERATEQDLAEANARLLEFFERNHYGPGGLKAWIGPVLRDGVEVPEPVQLRPPLKRLAAVSPSTVKVNRRGVAQLLWQCPVCRTNDALVHLHPRFRRETVICQACGTRWEFRRQPGHDFRMKVVEGAPEHVGLDMALSTWYEHMKNNFSPAPIRVAGVSLLPGEQVYLEAQDVPLSPYRPNALFDGWTGREPPKKQSGWLEVAGWDVLGQGRLLLTSHRLLWQSEEGELDFLWSDVTTVSLYMQYALVLNYGAAKYRFNMGNEPSVKWLHYAGEMAKRAAEREGRQAIVSSH